MPPSGSSTSLNRISADGVSSEATPSQPSPSDSSQKSISNSSRQKARASPTEPVNPIYSQHYGSSYVHVKPLRTPFNKVVEQTDDHDQGGEPNAESKKRRRAESDSPVVFDPSSPNLPRAGTDWSSFVGRRFLDWHTDAGFPIAPGNYPGLYSVSGFDALSVLARVMLRVSGQQEKCGQGSWLTFET